MSRSLMFPVAPARSDVTSKPLPAPLVPFLVGLGLAIVLFGAAAVSLWESSGDNSISSTAEIAAGILAIGVLVGGCRWIALFCLAYGEYRRLQKVDLNAIGHWPRVAILVPAYNESSTIEAALRSLLQVEYPALEIIVVDDGSKDDTYTKARTFAGEYANGELRVYRKPNGGKWSALNLAFHNSTADLVLCVDADSRLSPQCLKWMVARLQQSGAASVAGQVRVRNRTNLITHLQGLEYMVANGLIRLAQSQSGTVLVVPGPIGLFQRSVLEAVYERFGHAATTPERGPGAVEGPFEGDTFAEDFDLSLAILALGGRVIYEPRAISMTKAPDWTFRLLNQRYRWDRGTLQVLRKYISRFRSDPMVRHPRVIGWLALTYATELLLMPALNLIALWGSWALFAGGGLGPAMHWAAAFFVLQLNAALFFAVVHGETLVSLAVLPLYSLYHNILLNMGLLFAVVDEARGTKMRW